MTDESKRAILDLAKTVLAGKANSYVGASKVLAEFVVRTLGREEPGCALCGRLPE